MTVAANPTVASMRRAGVAIICGAMLVAVACGGGSEVTLRIRVDLSDLTEGSDADATVEQIADILTNRATSFNAGRFDISTDGDAILAAASGMDVGVARRLFLPPGKLAFREPVVRANGLMVCTDAAGESFDISPLQVNPDSVTGNKARCFGDNRLGEPQWAEERTMVIRTDPKTLADLVEPGSWQLRDGTSISVRFNDVGAGFLEELTSDLVGYPLGVFVDDELIGAPRIQRAITNGSPIISGFDELEARIRQAQLNASPLPAPVSEVSAE